MFRRHAARVRAAGRLPGKRRWLLAFCVVLVLCLALAAVLSDVSPLAKIASVFAAFATGVGVYDACSSIMDRRATDRHAPAQPPPPERQPRLTHLPHPRNPDFTGRTALLEGVRERLRQGYPVALYGMGGVGKTQLAAEFAHLYAADYDLVWWLRAEEPAQLTADCLELAAALELGDIPPAEALAQLLRTLQRRSRWLLIYDNAPGPDVLRAALPTGDGHCLITTRCPDWQGLAQAQPLGVWGRDESLAYLQRVTCQTEGADFLAELLSDLPLALAQAAAYVHAVGIGLLEYADRFQKRRAELWAREAPPPGYDATVATTWSLAIKEAAAASPAASDLLSLCAFLAPGDIPRALLREHADALPERLAAAVRDDLPLDDAVATLRRYSLLEATGDAWAVHRLVQTVTRDRLDEAERATWAGAAVRLVCAAFPSGDVQTDIQTWSACARLLPHALAATEHAEGVGLGRDKQLARQTAWLLNETGRYMQVALAQYVPARAHYERALRIDEAAYGPDHPTVAIRVNNLGSVLRDQGDLPGARAHYERALRINEAAYGPDHPKVATDVNNLGSILHDLGDLAGAWEHFERALRIDEAAYGPDHPEVATDVNNLGGVLRDQGDLAGAREHYERALRITEAAYGADHPAVAIRVNNLGLVLHDLGDLAGAREHYERALRITEAAYGPDHPTVAIRVNNLGLVLHDLGDLAGAREHHERALRIDEAAYGPDHPTVAIRVNNLGGVLRALGDLAGAREHYERALRIFARVLGPEHPNTLTVRRNLASLGEAAPGP